MAAEHDAVLAPSSTPSMPLLDLPDDLLAIILATLPDTHTLSAFACCCARLHELGSEPSLWRRFLLDRLRSTRWPLASSAAADAMAKDELTPLLMSRRSSHLWLLPRVVGEAAGATAGCLAPTPAFPSASAIFAHGVASAGFPAPTNNPFLLAAAAAAASFAFHHHPVAFHHHPMGAHPLSISSHHAPPPDAAASPHPHALSGAPAHTSASSASSPSSPNGPQPPSPQRVAPGLRIASDGLSVRYVGARLGGNRAVRCEPPLPHAPFDALRMCDGGEGDEAGGAAAWRLQLSRGCTVAYFELQIEEEEEEAGVEEDTGLDCIAVGLGSSQFPLSGRQPGWDSHSFGYHSDDGRLFHGSGTRSAAFGPRFAAGDTVGCGLCVKSRQIFYTLNGRFLGVAFVARASQMRKRLSRPRSTSFSPSAPCPSPLSLPLSAALYPLVGLDSRASIHFNFGQRPFAFDPTTLPASLTPKAKASTPEGASQPSTPTSALRQLAMIFARG